VPADPGVIGKDALVAILRGVDPQRVMAVAGVIYAAGIRIIEVPLNSPQPFKSIAALSSGLAADCLAGAGTVLNAEDVRRAHEAGARLIVSPNFDADVVGAALELDMQVLPGVATATEAFSAIRAGAKRLKLFPASIYGPKHLQALRTVLPADAGMLAVGGVAAEHIADWLAAGAAGFGFGSELYRPDYASSEIERRAQLLVRTLREARQRLDSADLRTTKTTSRGTA
jgi:2-dehydro-3-deoxyphosphogalactonate aldolase